jgi:hypothetical protein
MQHTTNLNLNKPELTDAPPDITVLNENWDALDTEIGSINIDLSGKADKDLANVTTADFLATIDRTEAIPYIFAANKAEEEEAIAGSDDVKYMTPLCTKEAIDASTPYRVGDIRFLGGPLNDSKYLPCNGQLLDMVDQPELYSTIGTYYGGVEPLEDLTEKDLGFVVKDMAAGNGLLVAVGAGGQIAVSGDNGATWTQQNSGITYEVGKDSVHVVYGNGIFIIYGYHGGSGGMVPRNDVYGTGDGTWTQRTLSSMGLSVPNHHRITYDMAYGNNLWMRVGTDVYTGGGLDDENVYNAMIYTSADNGATWTELSASDLGDEKIMSVSYGGGVFMTVGDRYYAGSSRTIGKYNGTSWSREYSADYNWISRLKYVDDEWLGLGYYSHNGSIAHI